MQELKRKVIFFIGIVIVVVGIMFLLNYFIKQINSKEEYENLKQEVSKEENITEETETEASAPVVIPIDFETLWGKNPDIYAWIVLEGTGIEYPILQHPTDDGYYLNHTIDHVSGLPGSIYTESTYNGTDFSDRNTLIYGHNMKNGTMFGHLDKYKDPTYMKEHDTIVIYTPEHIYTYKVFAAITYDNRHIMYSFDFDKETGMQEFLDSIRKVNNLNTYIDETVEVTSSDKIITLSTCNGNKKQRFLVEAVLIDEQ